MTVPPLSALRRAALVVVGAFAIAPIEAFPQRGKALAYRLPNRSARSAAQKQKMTQNGVTGTKLPCICLPDYPVLVRKGVLRTLVLSGLLVTFLPREKSPAGGITPDSTPSGTDRMKNSVSRRPARPEDRNQIPPRRIAVPSV